MRASAVLAPLLLAVLAASCGAPAAGTRSATPAAAEAETPIRPRLVVLLVVDQMRGDYLERFGHLWRGGFARLRAEGAVFSNAHHDHAVTFTAAGHATLSTGVHPARHGMISNRYWDRDSGKQVEVADDERARVVGVGEPPAQSPHRLRRQGVADWLLAASPRSMAIALALKNRAAVCIGGKQPTAVFWHDEGSGQFVTSSHYMDALPGWIEAFNAGLDGPALVAGGWDRVAPAETYAFLGPDREPHEADGEHVVFPHDEADLLALDPNPNRALRWSPLGDEVTFSLVSAALERVELGRDDHPDLLAVSLSSPDYVGHRYGPDSHELLDLYLRLDVHLGSLLEELDRRVGAGQWTLVLTSDHGVMPLPERAEQGERVALSRLQPMLERATAAATAETGLAPSPVPRVSDGVYLEFAAAVTPGQRVTYRAAFARALEQFAVVARAYSTDELAKASLEGPFVEPFRRSRDPERSPDVFVLPRPYHLVTAFQGTSHGTPYPHDTHVPIVLLGAGIEPGHHDRRVSAVDVAPTVAALLGIDAPEDLDGRPLSEAIAD